MPCNTWFSNPSISHCQGIMAISEMLHKMHSVLKNNLWLQIVPSLLSFVKLWLKLGSASCRSAVVLTTYGLCLSFKHGHLWGKEQWPGDRQSNFQLESVTVTATVHKCNACRFVRQSLVFTTVARQATSISGATSWLLADSQNILFVYPLVLQRLLCNEEGAEHKQPCACLQCVRHLRRHKH